MLRVRSLGARIRPTNFVSYARACFIRCFLADHYRDGGQRGFDSSAPRPRSITRLLVVAHRGWNSL